MGSMQDSRSLIPSATGNSSTTTPASSRTSATTASGTGVGRISGGSTMRWSRRSRTGSANHERLFAAVEEAYAALEESDGAVLDRLGAVAGRLREAAEIDSRLGDVRETLDTALVHLSEAARGLRDYRGSIEFDPERLEQIEARLHEIGRLKRKYGGSVKDLLAHLEAVREELLRLDRSVARREEIERTRQDDLEDLLGRAARLTASRRKSAASLEQGIRGELAELGMPKAAFSVQVTAGAGEDALGPFGFDAVEFLISPNPGEPLKPLHKIASGGELARVMLAIRTILAAADQTPTVIFDEVDAGIGGSMGDVVGRKLLASSQEHQVLCVTHLPQIACYGDQHLMVEKRTSRDRTDTVLHVLSPESRRHEVARMLGPSRTTTALDHASELLESAQRLKKRLKPARA